MKTFRCAITITKRSVCYYKGEVVCLMADKRGDVGMFDESGMVGYNDENSIKWVADYIMNDIDFNLESASLTQDTYSFEQWRSRFD